MKDREGETVSIPAMSIGMHHQHLMNMVSAQVMGMAMDQQENAGNGLGKLLESATGLQEQLLPHLGGNLDTTA